MKKNALKSLLALTALTVALTVPLSSVHATEGTTSADLNARHSEEALTRVVEVGNDLSIQKYTDGRIKGIDLSQVALSTAQKDEVLKQMNFNELELSRMSLSLKDDLISQGGIKVDLNTETNHTYTSLSGTDYIVTEQNKDEVNVIRQSDLETNDKNNSLISTKGMGSVNDGTFSGYSALMYLGKTANATEFKYSYVTYFNWSQIPYLSLGDTIAQAWNYNATRTATRGYYNDAITGVQKSLSGFNVGSVSGTSVLINSYTMKSGYLQDDVVIPVTFANTTGSFASGYAHAYGTGISVSIRVLGIDFSGLGDKWTWSNTFTIGQSS